MTEDPLANAVRLRNQLVEAREKLRTQLDEVDNVISQLDLVVSTLERGNISSTVDTGDGAPSINRITSDFPPNPRKEEVARHAREIVEEAAHPLSRRELFLSLSRRGVELHGTNPEMVLSTMLWRAGEQAGLTRLKKGGYWLKEVPWPAADYDPTDTGNDDFETDVLD